MMEKIKNSQSLKFYTILIPFCILCVTSVIWVDGQSISSAKPLEHLITSSSEVDSNEGASCEDELSSEACESFVESSSCSDLSEDSPLKNGCRRSCGFCEDVYDNEQEDKETTVVYERALEGDGGCEDKIPNCSNYVSVCCSMKEAMNSSCAKTCKFCSESPATMPPSAPGGAPGGFPAPTASSNQDPCNPTNPPSVTVDSPGAPGQTTTTAGPGNLPGNPVG